MMKKQLFWMIGCAMVVALFTVQHDNVNVRTEPVNVRVVNTTVGYAHIQEPGHEIATVPFHSWCYPKKNMKHDMIRVHKIFTTLPNGLTYTDYDAQNVRDTVCEQ